MMCFVTKATLMHRKLHYVSKCSKLVQLVVKVQYHVNVIYSLGGGHTHTHAHIPTLKTKAISRNQAHVSLLEWLPPDDNFSIFQSRVRGIFRRLWYRKGAHDVSAHHR